MKTCFIPLLLLAIAVPAQARDYGQQGVLFPVIEPDLLAQIHAKLISIQKSGETDRRNAELKARTIARAQRPDPAPGVANAVHSRSWLFDPTITLAENILGA